MRDGEVPAPVTGRVVSLTGEVAWLTAEGRKPYWRGTITAVAYEFAPP